MNEKKYVPQKKKPYRKPQLAALSLSSNDMLCAGCSVKLGEDDLDSGVKDVMDMFGYTYDQLLGSGDGCAFEITGYCKFTGTNVVMNS